MSVNDHQMAHVVGRDTAKDYGSNFKAFDLCPMTFNYGCATASSSTSSRGRRRAEGRDDDLRVAEPEDEPPDRRLHVLPRRRRTES